MKKLLSVGVASVLIFIMTACSSNGSVTHGPMHGHKYMHGERQESHHMMRSGMHMHKEMMNHMHHNMMEFDGE